MPGAVEAETSPPEGELSQAPAVELPRDETPARPYIVLKQSVKLDVDFRERAVHGCSEIMIAPTSESLTHVYIDARQADIDVSKITVSNCNADATYQDPSRWVHSPDSYEWSAAQWPLRKDRMKPLRHHRRQEIAALEHELSCQPANGSLCVKLPTAQEIRQNNPHPPPPDQTDYVLNDEKGIITSCTVRIPFKLHQFTDGLHFAGVEEGDARYPHLYTRHSVEPGLASSIFPCIDDPGSRHIWTVSVTFPRTLGDAFKKPLCPQQLTKGTGAAVNGNKKRKQGEDEPRRREIALTEEDKILEMTVVCSGNLEGEVINQDENKKTMTFNTGKNKPAMHVGFAVGPFEHIDMWSDFRSEEDDTKLGVNATKVHGYCLPGRAEEVRNTCSALVTAVDHFVLQFGRYPFEGYQVCFVDDMVEEVVPLCAFSLCSSRLLFPREIIDTEVQTTRTLVHALACQWFGVNIVPNKKSDIWLIVGIAWFMTDHFMKKLCGNNDFRFRMKSMADHLVQVDIKRPSLQDLGEHLYLGDFEMEFMNLKAPLVLFILDRRLSKSSGSSGLPKIISRMVSRANTSTEATDEILKSELFCRACEKSIGSKLDTFWEQWVTGSGCPRFDVYQRFNKKRLCVEMTVRQVQDIAAAKARPLVKNDFWRDVMEETHAVYAGELHASFSGPMTIRIHEADGTPYEHIVDIREEQAKSTKFEIPYNTKYKRLKRNRRQREKQMAGNIAKGTGAVDEAQEEAPAHLYCLGDLLQQPEEMEEWMFQDWDEATETKMDGESYEWIRMDADFEWVCDIKTNLPAYMYVSQLQQDKDVAAQQDSMLFMVRNSENHNAHPVVSTILARTLLDPRYYFGIRTMAAEMLPRHAVKSLGWVGMVHLQKTFQRFFCQPGTAIPKPNDFSDKRQYFVQMAIPEAIATVRGEDGACPAEARHFLLEQLRSNDNKENIYSDNFYICKLIHALALSLIPDEKKVKQTMKMSMSFGDGDEDEEMEDVDSEPQKFREMALDEIERYRRMDEYSPSYQNCFTTAALDALCRLMKANVIDVNPITFAQYLQDKTIDLVRIKACECMIELGLLSHPVFLRFFIISTTTDSSPFVRDRLFKALCRGLASIAFGDMKTEAEKQPKPAETGEDGLIVEQDDRQIEAKQFAKARKQDLTVALAALRKELKDEELANAIWDMLDSPVLSIAERINLVEVCSILVEEDYSLILRLQYPTYWTASRGEKSRHKCVVNFKRHVREKPRKTFRTPATSFTKPEPKRTITLNLNRNPSFSSKASAPPTPQTPAQTSGTVVAKPPAPPSAPPAASTPTPASKGTPLPKATPAPPKATPAPKVVPAPKATPKPIPKAASPPPKSSTPKPLPKSLPKSLPTSKPMPKNPILKTPLPNKSSPSSSPKPAGSASTPRPEAAVPKEKHRDSISVQTAVRSTVEGPLSSKAIPPAKPSGTATPTSSLKPPKSLKRSNSGEQDSGRPRKIVRLDTSKLSKEKRAVLESMNKSKRKVVTVKFMAWDRLPARVRNGSQTGGGSGGSTIRATPKKSLDSSSSTSKPLKMAKTASSTGYRGTSSSARSSPAFGARSSTPQASSGGGGNSQFQEKFSGGSGGIIRKPLPGGGGVRKPLPGGGSGGGGGGSGSPQPKHASPPGGPSSSSSSGQKQQSKPSSSSADQQPPPSKGPPTKLKIKLKPNASSSSSQH